MHTDEYEISLGREIAVCRKMVKRLKDLLERRQKLSGMTPEAFRQAIKEGCLSEQFPIKNWNQEYQELLCWQKTLIEYEKTDLGKGTELQLTRNLPGQKLIGFPGKIYDILCLFAS
jgi:hypothetical protein